MFKKTTSISKRPSNFKIHGKRLLAILLCVLTIMCSTLVSTNAGLLTTDGYADYTNTLTDTDMNLVIQTTVPRALYALVELPPDWWGWNYTPEQLRNAYLGAPINYVELSDGGIAQTVENKVVFPVVYNERIIATILIGKFDGKIYSTYGNATELGEAIAKNPGEDFVLLSEKQGAFVVTNEDDIIPLQQNPSVPTLSASAQVRRFDKSGSTFDLLSTKETTISQHELFSNTISVQTAKKFYSAEANEARKSLETKGKAVSDAVLAMGENILAKFDENAEEFSYIEDTSITSFMLDLSEEFPFQATAANNHGTATGDYLDSYQVVLQGNFNICWAATIASVLRWEMPNQHGRITAVDVVENTSHASIYTNSSYTGASQAFTRTTLDNYLPAVYIVNSSSSARTRAQIRTAINNEDPICMMLKSGEVGHAVANCGYLDWTDGSFTIRIMDPNYTSFQMSEYQSYGSSYYYTTPGGMRYKWNGSIYFTY